ncbi:MAG: glycosyltransferase [Alphaproteobacteria bacterium]|nr:glycosyltransferase [Alphaproteobacteria bacterium]
MNPGLKVSIITPSYNSAEDLEGCLKSVITQKYPVWEHLIIDNQSSDTTTDLVHSLNLPGIRFFSEPDGGPYDAMNKGIEKANGDLVGILNADDCYCDDRVIGDVAELLETSGADCLYADLVFVDRHNPENVRRYWKSYPFTPGSFSKGYHPPHPTFFVRRELYRKLGGFNTMLKISADFELMLRFLEKYRITACYLPRPIVRMRLGGISTGSAGNVLHGYKECYRAFGMNGIPVSPDYFIRRTRVILQQYWNREGLVN